MNTPPAHSDLSPVSIGQCLAKHWQLEEALLTYLPLGFGSHHWLATFPGGQTLFVTADSIVDSPDSADTLHRSMTTAWRLRHRADIVEVVAALPTMTGELVVPVNERWLMAVFPFLPLERGAWGAFRNEADSNQGLRLVARIHQVDRSLVSPDLPVRETFLIPHRDSMIERLGKPGEWNSGPYGEATRELLHRHSDAIRAGFALHDRLATLALAEPDDWVVTHGEPHAGNILRRADADGMVIVDWDTCAYAPRERDLWQLFPPDSTSVDYLQEYLAVTSLGREAISEDRLALYRLRWDLEEIAIYSHWFAKEHEDTEDMRGGWNGLVSSVELLAGHIARF